MSYSQFQEEEPPIPPQRLSAEEARAVIGLWQQRRDAEGGQVDLPSIPDVAEGLDISVEDAARLLGEVRARQAQKQQQRQADDQQTLLLEKIQRAEERRQRAELRRERAEWQRQQAEEQRLLAGEQRHWHRPAVRLPHPEQLTDDSTIPAKELRWLQDPKTWKIGEQGGGSLTEAQVAENERRVAAIERTVENEVYPAEQKWEHPRRRLMETPPEVYSEKNRRIFWFLVFLFAVGTLLTIALSHRL